MLNGTSDPAACSAYVERLFDGAQCRAHFAESVCFSNRGQPVIGQQHFIVRPSVGAQAICHLA